MIRHTLSIRINGGVNVDHLVNVVSATFFHYKATIFPFIINKYLIGRYFETMQMPCFSLYLLTKSIHWMVPACNSYYCYISSVLIFYLTSFPLHLFYSVGYNPVLPLLCCLNCPSFDYWELFQFGSCVLLTCHHGYFLVSPYFLAP